PHDEIKCRALPGAGAAEQRHNLPFAHIEAQIVDSDEVSKLLAHAVERDDLVGGRAHRTVASGRHFKKMRSIMLMSAWSRMFRTTRKKVQASTSSIRKVDCARLMREPMPTAEAISSAKITMRVA